MNFVATATEFILWLWMYFSVLLSVLNLSIKNFYNIITVLLWVSIRSLFCNHTHFSPTTQNITLPFPKKGDLGLAKNYRGITLTSIAAKIYNALLRNRIEPRIDNILRKNQNGFRRNRSTTSQILTIRRILEGVRAKPYRRHYYLSTLLRPSIPYTEGRWNKSY